MKLGHSTDDNAITTQIQARLFDDSVLKTRDIHVASDKGTVTLSGTVNTDLEKAAAERIAGQAEGVKSVADQLVVSSAPYAGSQAAMPQAAEAAPQAPLPAAPESRQPRSSRHHRHAAGSNSDAATAEQPSAQVAPAENPAATTAQAGCRHLRQLPPRLRPLPLHPRPRSSRPNRAPSPREPCFPCAPLTASTQLKAKRATSLRRPWRRL